MELCYESGLVMPSSYAMMDEEEMTYVDGGVTIKGKDGAKIVFPYGLGVNYYNLYLNNGQALLYASYLENGADAWGFVASVLPFFNVGFSVGWLGNILYNRIARQVRARVTEKGCIIKCRLAIYSVKGW